MFKQLAIIIGCLAAGEFFVWLTNVPVPSSVIGMLLLTLLLKLGVVKENSVSRLSDFLVANMGFFFVPPGVALMLYFDVIEAEFLPIVVSVFVSTIIVLVFTGWSHSLTRKILGKVNPKIHKYFKDK
ncbi:MAG: CidA/LrgA family protein [Bacteroidaceae bacterium]|nr:CidA/LrgA family protein [Bacteroidaceae bacterium]